jgi:MYXO-CTERM domain-containing protein
MRKSSFGWSAVFGLVLLGCSGESPESEPSLPPVVSEPLIGAPAKPVRTIAGLMFDLGAGPPNATTAQNVWMGATNSVRGLYIESSYGVQDIDIDLLGPWTLPVANKCLTLACCGPSSDQTGNGDEVQRIIDSLPMDYMHYGYLYGSQSDSGCGTWGDAGNPNRPAVYSSYTGSSLIGGAQEIGHNLGMAHEHTMDCDGQTMPDNTSSCANVEYGSRLSFMGMGRGHPSAYHKVHMGWLSGCNVVTAGGEGTFTLFPLETPCNATQVIQVAAPKTRQPPSGTNTQLTHYYLEFRVPIGYDSMAVNGPQVVIYISGNWSAQNRYASHTFLLDLTPSTSQLNDAGLATVGQSFADPGGGLTFTLDAVSMTSATVRISGNGMGAHMCQGGTPFTAPGPADCGMGPTGGMGGMAGTTGASGAGGAPGGAGPGGAGVGGLGGAAGSGVAGSAGSGVVGGSTSTGGAAGSLATGGASGTVATGGSTTGGSATGGGAGSGQAGAGEVVSADAAELDGGCGCRTTTKRSNGALLSVLLAMLVFVRRRRARA